MSPEATQEWIYNHHQELLKVNGEAVACYQGNELGLKRLQAREATVFTVASADGTVQYERAEQEKALKKAEKK